MTGALPSRATLLGRTTSPGRRRGASRALRAAAAAVVVAGIAGGCAGEQPLPAPRPQGVPAPAPAVPADRAAAVHAEVEEAVAAADAAGDAALLAPRVTGAAQEVRAARYRLRQLVEDAPAPAPLGGEALRDVVPAVGLPGAQEGEAPERAPAPAEAAATFPRTWLTITQSPEAGQAPQLSVLVQEDARGPYRVVTTAGLLPGAVVPPVAAPEQGAPPVDPASAEGLVLSPEDAVAQYAAALTDPEATEAAGFADDAFRREVLAERAEADAVDFFALETSRSPRPGSVRAVATADGGALVVGVLESRSVQAVEAEGAVLRLDEQTAALAGREDAPGRLEQRWLEVVALSVPPAGDGGEPAQVQVVGADRVLVEASAS
ncbi:hypothetical protein [uncultured Pseudokineococcus sp.]|uniref:hypothetical protein n=1 Tax=uncultured Pseudokineococcus sp. TaxID=1642928 RepID=UPI0026358DA3|nr:hypothetical protein [uncultured Pseudokineococcus sp.]